MYEVLIPSVFIDHFEIDMTTYNNTELFTIITEIK